ncbi:MAG: hypothetical protein ABEJ03_02540 [Candidatus Nanohaloarchaea archaeon]
MPNTDVVVFIDALKSFELNGVLDDLCRGEMDADVPRVTPRVMSSIYTGLSPAENGMMEVSRYGGEDTTRPKKSTFIDQAVREGMSVLSMGMPFCIPFQEANEDSMLQGDALQGANQAVPEDAGRLLQVPAPSADMIRDHPDTTYSSFLDHTRAYFTRFKENLRQGDFDVAFLGYRLVDCYDEETEILTEEGWKFFEDLDYEDKVATLNQDTHELEYQHPQALVSRPHSGKMYRLKTNQIDLMTTPNNRLYHASAAYGRGGDPENFELSEAEDIFGNGFRVKKDAEWSGKNNQEFELPSEDGTHIDIDSLPMEEWLEFLGFWVGDGTLSGNGNYEVFIGQSRESNGEEFERIKQLMDELGFNYHVSGKNISFRSKQVHEFLRNYWKPKKVPDFVKNLSSELIENFIQGAVLSDGWEQGGTKYFANTSKQLVDDLQELGLKAGYTCNISADHEREGGKIKGRKIESAKTLYRLSFQTERDEPRVRTETREAESNTEEWVDYDGMVYDVTVPNHVIYVRRNGKPVWAGNSYCHFQHTEERNGKPYRQHLIDHLQRLVAEIDAQVDGDVMFFSDHGQTELEKTFRINRWLKKNGWLEYSVDYDFIDDLQEYQGGERHPVDERVENQVTFGQPGVKLDEENSKVVCSDPFDSCLTLLCDREDFNEEKFREELMETGMFRSVKFKWELYDEDADFYETVPDIIPDRAEGVFVSGNLHENPIGMGYYRTGVHDYRACYGATCELNVPEGMGRDGMIVPEQMYDVIADFIGLEMTESPLQEEQVKSWTEEEVELAREQLETE